MSMILSYPLLITFSAYFGLLFVLGLIAYRQTQSLDDYILGGRKLGPTLVALSVGASDMSGWLLLGLPGAVYLSGLSEIWIGVGLVFGAYLNWRFIARSIRIYSERASNALTLPDYFEFRFNDQSRIVRSVSAVVILLFFTFYVASGLVGGALLFESSFSISYNNALLGGCFIIVSYTFIGGFLAVVWTDAVQAILILLALVIVPFLVLNLIGNSDGLVSNMESIKPGSTNLFSGISVIGFLSLIGWGLGYFGQPHILTRFMAAQNPDEMNIARRAGMSWMIIVLFGSVASGLAGIIFFAEDPLDNSETVFIALNQSLFNPWVAGIITAAILSAIMSTVDSQLLVSASVISEDFYRVFIRSDASQAELILVSRIAVICVACVALWIASDRNNNVLNLVSYAWAGFGAAFGPVIIFSLFVREMTSRSAVVSMFVGAFTVIAWSRLEGGIFDLYEIIPGFAAASFSIVLSSKLAPEENTELLNEFDDIRSEIDAT